MVDAFQHSILQFLNVVHRAPRALGMEELARTERMPDARTLYRWQRALADDLLYYPSITFRALGLDHVHLVIDDPSTAWEEFAYAIRGEWVTRHPGHATLYLHCLVPDEHREDLLALLDEVRERGACSNVTSIATADGWQVMRDITNDASELETVPASVLRGSHSVWEVVERVPLLIPVIFETVEQRRNLPQVWRRIYGRLGERAWEYLPRGATRKPNNGKADVKDVYALLNHTGLFRQNIIRYQPLANSGTTMLLRLQGDATNSISAFTKSASVLDLYPISETEVLLRVETTHAAAQRIMSATNNLPRITDWYFVDTTRPRVQARFAYELLFDPMTTEWVFPRDEILRRLTKGAP
jgi:hypothetical protein